MKTKLKLKSVLFLTVLTTLPLVSQSRRLADRYFEDFAYTKAVKIYEAIYKKGDSSKIIVKRIGDSYYNNSKTEEAGFWYKKLIEEYKESDKSYLFKYAQVLQSNGLERESDSIFTILEVGNNDYTGDKYVDESDYFQDFLNGGNKKINIRNLAINTPFSDFGGVVYNNEIYFASSSPTGFKGEKLYRWNNQPFLNIYKSKSYIDKLENTEHDTIFELENKKILPAPISTKFHESSAIFTKDGKYMYFSRVNYNGKRLKKSKKQTVNLKLYRAENVDGNWANIEELPFSSNEYSVGHPALSADEKILYFASDMPGSIGKTDIFKVEIRANGFGEPENLGEQINTAEREMFPFMSKSNVLYFSSNGHRGSGLLDIFQTKVYENGTYSKIENLGYPFNSKKDDFSFYIDTSGKKGFFSSNRSKGKGDDDIYSFYISQLPTPKPEKCNQSVRGVIVNKITNEKIPNVIVKLIDKETRAVIGKKVTNNEGFYSFDELECGEDKLTITAEHKDYRGIAKKEFSLSNENEKKFIFDLLLDPLIIGNQIVVKPIYFDYSKAIIRDDAKYELENIVTVMNNHPNMVIKIESHTDSRGGSNYNRSLSDKRAKATRDYIVSKGISSNRIRSAIGYGEDQLLNHCDDKNKNKCSEEEHQLNRRSYFYIVSGKNDVTVTKVKNDKPKSIAKKELNNSQKEILKKLRKMRNPKKKSLRLRQRLGKRRDNKCYKGEECSSF
ncbi:OmpA family protein [Tenacibaculum agarivorans]|uniref:OmpA family protein n=1 Tax=Tenacibaculum agarivorans TaxID=1908389 RepID=UPI00094B92C8|nr:OmpA family protein [Tenacibaculum agarivorans]